MRTLLVYVIAISLALPSSQASARGLRTVLGVGLGIVTGAVILKALRGGGRHHHYARSHSRRSYARSEERRGHARSEESRPSSAAERIENRPTSGSSVNTYRPSGDYRPSNDYRPSAGYKP